MRLKSYCELSLLLCRKIVSKPKTALAQKSTLLFIDDNQCGCTKWTIVSWNNSCFTLMSVTGGKIFYFPFQVHQKPLCAGIFFCLFWTTILVFQCRCFLFAHVTGSFSKQCRTTDRCKTQTCCIADHFCPIESDGEKWFLSSRFICMYATELAPVFHCVSIAGCWLPVELDLLW